MPTAPSVGSDVGAGAPSPRGRVAAGAIEAAPIGAARVRRRHALARGRFPRGCERRCSVSLPTSWCMGRRLCDVMARWTSAFEGSRSKWTGLGWASPSGARRLTASCLGRAADRAGAGCRMLSSASSRALTTRATAFAACRRGGEDRLREGACVDRQRRPRGRRGLRGHALLLCGPTQVGRHHDSQQIQLERGGRRLARCPSIRSSSYKSWFNSGFK